MPVVSKRITTIATDEFTFADAPVTGTSKYRAIQRNTTNDSVYLNDAEISFGMYREKRTNYKTIYS